jgi:hypothetical protein
MDYDKQERMLRTLIQFSSLSFTFIATFFWIRGVAFLTLKELDQLASSYWDGNPHMLSNMVSQKVDSIIAGALLFISFILQTWNALWPMTIDDIGTDQTGVLVAIALTSLVFVICFPISSWLKKYYLSAAKSTNI